MEKSLPSWIRQTLCLLITIFALALPQSVNATTIYYKDAQGNVQSTDATALTSSYSTSYTISEGNYYVSGTISVLCPLIINGSVQIILLDGAQLNAKGCIVVEGSNSLTITTGNTTSTIAGTGKALVTDSYNGDADEDDNDNDGDDARIGSREDATCGTITINDGTIEIYSTYTGTNVCGADIGSGYEGNGGTITINGGTITCDGAHKLDKCQMEAACIGSGF